MAFPPKLQAFVDGEIARVPALIEQVRRQTIDALQRPGDTPISPAERMIRYDLAQVLAQHPQKFCESFTDTLSKEILVDPAQTQAQAPLTSLPMRLSLVEDSSLSIDVELSRTVEQIGTVADWELRELQTFTSALCELPHVSVASNPLRPEAFAHALWQAAISLSLAPSHQVLLLRTGANPLAIAVQRAYAAACSRLEMDGVQPSQYAFRTGSQEGRDAAHTETLVGLLANLQPQADPKTRDIPAQTSAGVKAVNLLNQIFLVIVQDTYMHPEVRATICRLQSSASKLAQQDAALFSNVAHPLWKLLRAFAFQSATHPNPTDPSLLAWLGFAGDLITAMQAEPLHDAEMYLRSAEQLDAYAAAQFNAQLQQFAEDISALKRADLNSNPGTAALGPEGMDTVPAALLDSGEDADDDEQVSEWLGQQRPGQWYRLYINGRWTITRLLWCSDSGDRWLLTGQPPKRSEALTRAAMTRLRAERLIRTFVERELVLRAARRLSAEV